MNPMWKTLLTTVLYTAFGLAAFAVVFWITVKISPVSVKKEIEDDQNTALAILIGAVFIGIALIIASAIHG